MKKIIFLLIIFAVAWSAKWVNYAPEMQHVVCRKKDFFLNKDFSAEEAD